MPRIGISCQSVSVTDVAIDVASSVWEKEPAREVVPTCRPDFKDEIHSFWLPGGVMLLQSDSSFDAVNEGER
jgi:hypothetical protein